MSLESSIFTALSDAASDTAAIIGAGSDCKLYDGQAPARVALPYAVYSRISSSPESTHDASSDLDLIVIQFSCVASSLKAARALVRAIRADLTDTALTSGEKAVEFVERSGFSESVDAHVAMVDVSIWHNPLSS